MTIMSLCLAHVRGRYSGGSHRIFLEDEVTQSPLISSTRELKPHEDADSVKVAGKVALEIWLMVRHTVLQGDEQD